jgi:hypothetical protein
LIKAAYALLTLSQEAISASEGRAKKYANLLRTSVSEKIIRSAPTMKASTIDATVISTSDHGITTRRLRGSGLMMRLFEARF